MKKYLLGLAAVVVALSLSAFTGDYKKVEKSKGPNDLHWFAVPIQDNIYLETTTSVSARDANSDCTQTETTECERAYKDADLIDPATPGLGVKTNRYGNVSHRLYFQ